MTQMKLDTKVLSILKEKIQLIKANKGNIYLVGPIKLPINLYGETVEFKWYCWLNCDDVPEINCEEAAQRYEKIVEQLSSSNLAEYQQSSVLVYGDFENGDDAIIRFHSICHTGDIFGSKRCDCGFQLKQSLKMIAKHGTGALFYLANHEGRGIGLFSKAMAYILQENGYDTVEANVGLGFVDDARNYEDAVLVLRALRTKPITLITNNPKKVNALKSAGLEVTGREPLWGDVSSYNRKYLLTKIKKSGHLKNEGIFPKDS